ncbi:hypothetical protein AgCh_013778 [Apium graveolens]
MDAMHDIQSRFARDLIQALGTAFRATRVDIQWPVFGEDSVYPPLDTPETPPVEGEDSDSHLQDLLEAARNKEEEGNIFWQKAGAPALVLRVAAPEEQKVSAPALIKRAAALGKLVVHDWKLGIKTISREQVSANIVSLMNGEILNIKLKNEMKKAGNLLEAGAFTAFLMETLPFPKGYEEDGATCTVFPAKAGEERAINAAAI